MNYSGAFCCQGNLFADLESLSLKVNITPRQPKISEMDGRQREYSIVRAYDCYPDDFKELYKPLYLSLPSNDDLSHCWFPSPLDSSTNISSQGSYNVFLTLVTLAHPQDIGTALQSHLFGTEIKVLVLWSGGQ